MVLCAASTMWTSFSPLGCTAPQPCSMNMQMPSNMPWKQMMCKTCYTIWMMTLLLAHHTPWSVPTTSQPWLLHVRSLASPLMQIRSQNQLQPQTSWGVDIDLVAMEARIYSTHLSETISLLKGIVGHWSATKRSILSLIGKLHFVCWVCRPGRAFLHAIWSKHPWRLSTSITESSWTRSFIGMLSGGCAICLHGMGSAYFMSPTGSPVQNVSSSPMPVT